ncbi:regulation of nuclear pre-mRNA domain-containing protein 1B-like [Chenopodium quinoa]|uniref:CID domain-containing protein n=1 Tax=Chenopodium quinoa TaxID=63459 RepID=A0A803KSN5_CHEQI|nr:regulation of nuclear pre-mRNA domain-containing protein 1B-like [Chenopodium quinoa]
MNSVFSEQILADKLSKLNSTQQCIETLSHWCIFHRSKAEVVVATWNQQFHSSEMTQKVPLLYLANDILQNSKRKGNEFVIEFWKVLPQALKDVHNKGDDQGKKVVSRLVTIWDERKVFGNKAQNLIDIMLKDEALPPLEFSKKRSRTVKIVRRDSRSIRTKLSIGGPAEKIVTAFHSVLNEHLTEESEMSRCKSAVNRVRKIDHDVEKACAQAKDPQRKTLAKQLEEDEAILKECVEKLKSVEANRAVLVTQLKETLQEQESELENVRTQMQVAKAQAEEANNMRKRLNDENYVATPNANAGKSKKTAADIAAEVADKLTASSSSQLIMTSVLSTFAAEEAKKKAGLAKTNSVSSSYPSQSVSSALNSMSKQEQPPSVSLPAAPPNQYQSMLVNQQNMQNMSPNPQTQYQLLSNPTSQQYAQTPRGINSYGYGGLPPPGPPPPHVMHPMMPMAQNQMQMNQQQMMPMAQQSAPLSQQQSMMLMQQQPPAPPSFRPLQPPGMVYYTQTHQLQ